MQVDGGAHEVNLVSVETNQNDPGFTFKTIQGFLGWMIRQKRKSRLFPDASRCPP